MYSLVALALFESMRYCDVAVKPSSDKNVKPIEAIVKSPRLESLVQTTIRLESDLKGKIEHALIELGGTFQATVAEGLRMWLTTIRKHQGFVPITALLPTQLYERMLDAGRAHGQVPEQLIRSALFAYLEEREVLGNPLREYQGSTGLSVVPPQMYSDLAQILESQNPQLVAAATSVIQACKAVLDARATRGPREGGEATTESTTGESDVGPDQHNDDPDRQSIGDPGRRKVGSGGGPDEGT